MILYNVISDSRIYNVIPIEYSIVGLLFLPLYYLYCSVELSLFFCLNYKNLLYLIKLMTFYSDSLLDYICSSV